MRSIPIGCKYPGCLQSTREGKPYCPDHFDQNPYAKTVLQYLAKKETEIQVISAEGASAVETHGNFVQEVIEYLQQNGECSINRIAKYLSSDAHVIRAICVKLKEDNVVTMRISSRNGWYIKIHSDFSDE